VIWSEGQSLEEIKKGPISEELLKQYAETARDPNPIHLDPEFAKAAGFPSVIAHGMLSMAFLADAIRLNFPESEFKVERFSARFRKVTFPGSVLTVKGKIKKVESDSVVLLLSIENEAGEVTTSGEAQVVAKRPRPA